MTVHHLLAVYSGGKLDLSGAGFQSDSVNHGPAPGIGMFI
jgi:ABC-type enterobactin transport system permease subunit